VFEILGGAAAAAAAAAHNGFISISISASASPDQTDRQTCANCIGLTQGREKISAHQENSSVLFSHSTDPDISRHLEKFCKMLKYFK
jgi:hypothetical protein